MDQANLLLLIRYKLQTGVLPPDSIPRAWSGLGNGETCDACELSITNGQWVTEGLSLGGDRKLQLHVECFHFWERERRTLTVETEPPIGAADDGPDDR